MGTVIRDTSRLFALKELIMSHAQILSMMNLLGMDTTGVTTLDLRVVKEVGSYLVLVNGQMTETESVNFHFNESIVDVQQNDFTIIGVDFSPPI